MTDTARIKQFMEKLGISQEEAQALLANDKAVDRMKDGEVNADLTDEQRATLKKMRQADHKPAVYNFSKRERKPNAAKREIIQTLDEALCDIADAVTVTNQERQIDFVIDDVKYRVILSAPRT